MHKSNKDIRWKQRFENYRKAQTFLQESLKKETLSELEKAGIVQAFEFSFELAWKTMKDYLNEKGVEALYPREVIKQAFKHGLIADGELWMDMLDSRNLMSHTYKETDSDFVFNEIRIKYSEALHQLSQTLKKEQ